MKNFLLSFLILSFCVSGIYAQSGSEKVKDDAYYCKALNQYLVSLDHKNDGVVESAIINLMKLSRACPDIQYQATLDRLDQLAKSSRTANIKLLASIAFRYIQDSKNPDLFADIKVEDREQLVNTLLNRLL